MLYAIGVALTCAENNLSLKCKIMACRCSVRYAPILLLNIQIEWFNLLWK